MRKAFILAIITAALAACGGGGGGGGTGGGGGNPPVPTPTPTASPVQPTPTPTPPPGGGTPTPTPTPTATPNVPQGFVPFASSANFAGGSLDTGSITLGYHSPTGSTCQATSGVPNSSPAGDVLMIPDASKPFLIDYSIFQDAKFVSGPPNLIVAKDDVSKDVWITGYISKGVATCLNHASYLFVPTNTSTAPWSYTDIDGKPQTATIAGVLATQTFTVVGGPKNGTSTTYTNVMQINYGSNFTVYWALGVGPVQSLNKALPAGANPAYPLNWTAYSYVTH